MSHTQPPHWVWRYICLILHTDYPQHQNMQQAFFDPLPAHSNTFTLIHSFIRGEWVTKEHSLDSFSPDFLFSWIIFPHWSSSSAMRWLINKRTAAWECGGLNFSWKLTDISAECSRFQIPVLLQTSTTGYHNVRWIPGYTIFCYFTVLQCF